MAEKINWHYISTPPSRGTWNMAFDELLSRKFLVSTQTPILRIYGWSPPALSFGRFQDTSLIDPTEDLQYVRRMTGGGAILHHNEITYSLCASLDHLRDIKNIKESYRYLTAFIMNSYRKLGLKPEYAKDVFPEMFVPGNRNKSFICFEGFEPFDILINKKKIGGHAQYRKGNTVFQHGSIPLNNDWNLLKRVFGISSGESQMTSLRELDIREKTDDITFILLNEFQNSYSCSLTRYTIPEQELRESRELEEQKYKDTGWTWERKQRI